MSAVLGIITAHNGAVQLSSQPGKGSTLKIYLPVPPGSSTRDNLTTPGNPAEEWHGSGTILLVEDDEQFTRIAGAMIEKLGFSVITAANGIEALELYRKQAAEITMVLTDIDMPFMDGYALFRELKAQNPALPIIISCDTGADTVITSHIAQQDIAGLVLKPFNFGQLRVVLKFVVDVILNHNS
jgi:CheY-like chemotaxis protein